MVSTCQKEGAYLRSFENTDSYYETPSAFRTSFRWSI